MRNAEIGVRPESIVVQGCPALYVVQGRVKIELPKE